MSNPAAPAPTYPLWVRISLLGAPTRQKQRNAMFGSAIAGVAMLAFAASERQPLWMALGAFFVLSALRTWFLIRWMDARRNW